MSCKSPMNDCCEKSHRFRDSILDHLMEHHCGRFFHLPPASYSNNSPPIRLLIGLEELLKVAKDVAKQKKAESEKEKTKRAQVQKHRKTLEEKGVDLSKGGPNEGKKRKMAKRK